MELDGSEWCLLLLAGQKFLQGKLLGWSSSGLPGFGQVSTLICLIPVKGDKTETPLYPFQSNNTIDLGHKPSDTEHPVV